MTKTGHSASGETRRLVWGGVFVIVMFGGYLAGTYLPPAQSEEQALTTTVVAGDHDHPYGLASGTLQSSRGEGLGAEMQTLVTYEISGTPGDGIMNGPDLRARVIHDSGAVMVCADMWRTPRLEEEGRTVTLDCDRIVDFDELSEWSAVELTACFNIQQFDELSNHAARASSTRRERSRPDEMAQDIAEAGGGDISAPVDERRCSAPETEDRLRWPQKPRNHADLGASRPRHENAAKDSRKSCNRGPITLKLGVSKTRGITRLDRVSQTLHSG